MTDHPLLVDWRLWQESQSIAERTNHERTMTMRHLALSLDADLLRLSARDIVSYVGRPGLRPSSRASYHATIRAFCAWLVVADYRSDDPSLKTPRPRRPKGMPRPISERQFSDLLAQCNRRRTLAYVFLATFGGLRAHEIAKFHGHDIDPHLGTITVVGKGSKTALIPAHDRILELAADYPSDDYWFRNRFGDPVLRGAVSQAIGDAMQRADIRAKPHALRHYYATELLERGANLRSVQELMRHESPATTAIYTRMPLERMRADLARLSMPGERLAA